MPLALVLQKVAHEGDRLHLPKALKDKHVSFITDFLREFKLLALDLIVRGQVKELNLMLLRDKSL